MSVIQILFSKSLSDSLMVVVEMLFKAQDYAVEKLSKSRYDLLGVVEFIVRVEVRNLVLVTRSQRN